MDAVSHLPLEALTVPALLDQAVARFSNRPALNFAGRRWTYGQLGALVDRSAAGLQQLGIGRGDRIGICLPNTPYFVVFYYAILKIGAVVVNYNPLYVGRELRAQMADSGTTVMVAPDLEAIYPKVAGLLDSGLKQVIVCPFAGILPVVKATAFRMLKRQLVAHPAYGEAIMPFRTLVAGGTAPSPVAIDPDDLAVLQYTGGTTGVPKGAMLSHANLTVNAQQVMHHMPSMRPGEERMMGVLPFFHVFAMTAVLNGGVLLGGEIILHPRFELRAVMKSLLRDRPTIFHAVPTIYNAIAAEAEKRKLDVSSLRACISGGAPLPAEIRERFQALTGCRVIEGYGLTEASPVVACNPPDGEVRPGSVGIPMQDTRIEIRGIGNPGTLMAAGERGEICVRGPQVMMGYLDRPRETEAVFADGALRTGDAGHLDADGYLYVTDRLKDLIICSGYNVYPRTIEDALYEHPAVAEVIVIGIPDAYRGQAPLAFVTLRPGQTATGEALLDFLRERISKIELPVRVELRASLPKTMIGKLSRKDLTAELGGSAT